MNRIAIIQELLDTSQWHHVSTLLNPADDATQGMVVEEMNERGRWIERPAFLWEDKIYWPENTMLVLDLTDNVEVKWTITAVTSSTSVQQLIHELWSRYSS